MSEQAVNNPKPVGSKGYSPAAKILMIVCGLALALLIGRVALPLLPSGEDPDVEFAKMAISDRLLDPSSAQFTAITVKNRAYDGKKVVCGFVNGKNAFGGYTGFKRFFYAPQGNGLHVSGDDSLEVGDFEVLWKHSCE